MSTSSTARTNLPDSDIPQSSPMAVDANQNLARVTQLPRRHRCSKPSMDTFTAISEFDRCYGSIAPWQQSRISTCPNFLQHYSSRFPHAQSQPILVHHHLNCYYCPGPPPTRRLPSLPILDGNVEDWEYSLETAESDAESTETDLVLDRPKLHVDSLQGFPYFMGTSDAMEQRSQALAKAEESTCHKTKISRQKARLMDWISRALTDISADGNLPRYSCRRRCVRSSDTVRVQASANNDYT